MISTVVNTLDDERIAVRRGSAVDVIRRVDLLSVHSRRNVTRLVTRSDELWIYVPFGQVVDALQPMGVLRIHRGIAVNIACVRRLVGRGQHRVFLVLEDDRELTVGRGYQAGVRRHFGAHRATMA